MCLFKKVCPIFLLFTSSFLFSQECPNLIAPLNGSVEIPIDATIEWESISGVPGYLISLGTTPNGTDIISNQTVGNGSSYKPLVGLPENTRIYVSITLFFFNQPNIPCESQSFTTSSLTNVPDCTFIRRPLDQSTDINASTNITWDYASGATGYSVTLGTTATGGEIVNNENVGNVLQFKPTSDLPLETTFYLSVVPYNRIGDALGCSTIIFTTSAAATLPTCTIMTYPQNETTNVPLSPTLEWAAVAEAEGYKVTIGTTPFNANILNNVTLRNNFTNVLEFEPNRTFFIRIVPFNDAGDALGCIQESFSTLLGCGPYIDPDTGELVNLKPIPTIPDVVNLCSDTPSNTITAPDNADGYRWYRISPGSNETLISTAQEVIVEDGGNYRYELYDIIEDSGNSVECSNSKVFQVVISGTPIISSIEENKRSNGYDYNIITASPGSYEYAYDDINGPYQTTNSFTSIPPGTHTFYVRDVNGCGIAEKTIEQDLTVNGFPKFFTPNGDGTNDYWQFIPPTENLEDVLEVIFIFDRFGNLLKQLRPNERGWDGTSNGIQVSATDYWYRATFLNRQQISGHFSLIR